MSSTNRGYDRHKADYYVTPKNAIKDFLSEFLQDEKIDRPDRMKWLDPCAGGDEKHPGMPYPDVIKKEFDPDVLDTLDIREDSLATYKTDYLNHGLLGYDIVISNPPFYAAKEFVEQALLDVNPGGYVIFLLRLNFLGSIKRKDFLQNNMPKYIYVHHRRMSFTDDGETDSIEYAHFVWQKDFKPEFSKLIII